MSDKSYSGMTNYEIQKQNERNTQFQTNRTQQYQKQKNITREVEKKRVGTDLGSQILSNNLDLMNPRILGTTPEMMLRGPTGLGYVEDYFVSTKYAEAMKEIAEKTGYLTVINVNDEIEAKKIITPLYEDYLPIDFTKADFTNKARDVVIRSCYAAFFAGSAYNSESSLLHGGPILTKSKLLMEDPYEEEGIRREKMKVAMYRLCYPIIYEADKITCQANSIFINIRIYRLTFLEYLSKTVNYSFVTSEMERDIIYYNYIYREIFVKNQSGNFIQFINNFFINSLEFKRIDWRDTEYEPRKFEIRKKNINDENMQLIKKMVIEADGIIEIDNSERKYIEDGNEEILRFTIPDRNTNINGTDQLRILIERNKEYFLSRINELITHEDQITFGIYNMGEKENEEPKLEVINSRSYTDYYGVVMTEGTNFTFRNWCSRKYKKIGMNKLIMIHCGSHNIDVWYSVIFQILTILYILSYHQIIVHDIDLDNYFLIREVSNITNGLKVWKYRINGVDFMVPNMGAFVLFDNLSKTNIYDINKPYITKTINDKYLLEDIIYDDMNIKVIYKSYTRIKLENKIKKIESEKLSTTDPKKIKKLREKIYEYNETKNLLNPERIIAPFMNDYIDIIPKSEKSESYEELIRYYDKNSLIRMAIFKSYIIKVFDPAFFSKKNHRFQAVPPPIEILNLFRKLNEIARKPINMNDHYFEFFTIFNQFINHKIGGLYTPPIDDKSSNDFTEGSVDIIRIGSYVLHSKFSNLYRMCQVIDVIDDKPKTLWLFDGEHIFKNINTKLKHIQNITNVQQNNNIQHNISGRQDLEIIDTFYLPDIPLANIENDIDIILKFKF